MISTRSKLPYSAGACAAACLLILLCTNIAQAGETKRVLVLHSYHRGFSWTDNIAAGIDSIFSRPDAPPVDLNIEFMDTKRFDRAALFPRLKDLYRSKYDNTEPDVIITSDDNALDFMLAHRNDLFPDVPVVFCGVNNFNDSRIEGHTGFTGVSEVWDLRGTLDTALGLHPKATTMAVVTDATSTAAHNLDRFRKITPLYEDTLDFKYLGNLTAVELAAELANLDKKTIILNLSFFRDRTGRVFSTEEGNRLITEASGRPVYTCWDFYLGTGVVGGMMVSGFNQGAEAARMAVKILKGILPKNIPIMRESPNLHMFDHEVMRRFGIPMDALPPGSFILNRPQSFYFKYRTEIWLLGGAFGILTVLVVIMGINILSRRKAEQSLKESEQRYALVVRGANDGIWDWDLGTDRVYFSARYKKILGYTEEEFPDHADEWRRRVHPEDLDRVMESNKSCMDGHEDHFEIEYRMRHKDGSYRWILGRGTALCDDSGKAYRMAGTHTDITHRKIMETQLRHLALHDPLTGLANRTLCRERIGRAMERGRRRKGYFYAVLFIDLDRFKIINDSLGHTRGDKILAEVGDRLTKCIRSLDTASRWGGDEFVILLEEMDSLRMPVQAVRRIREALSDPFILDDRRLQLSASIGIVMCPMEAGGPEDLLQNANIAMHRAKERGRNRFKVFTPRMREHAMDIMALENDMDQGLARNEFFLVFQPIVHVDDEKRIYGFETLVRWNHPTKGLVMPGDFIEVAEETGKITALGLWVLREACTVMAEWARVFPKARDYVLSVNVSPRQLVHADFYAQVKRILDETDINPAQLNLEITETALMESGTASAGKLAELKTLGPALSIDDFGTGYSSMAYLSRLPLNHLKIDLSFVRGMDDHMENREIVRTIINLAHSLGLKVVAEGVESRMHQELLSNFECDYYQGYLCSRPVSMKQAENMIRLGHPCTG